MQMMGFKFVSAKNEQNNQWLEIGCSSLTQLKLRKEGIRNFPYTGHDICRNSGDGLQFDADEFIARDSRTSSGRFLTRELFHHTRAMNFHGAGAMSSMRAMALLELPTISRSKTSRSRRVRRARVSHAKNAALALNSEGFGRSAPALLCKSAFYRDGINS
jgi:hypothetical protein